MIVRGTEKGDGKGVTNQIAIRNEKALPGTKSQSGLSCEFSPGILVPDAFSAPPAIGPPASRPPDRSRRGAVRGTIGAIREVATKEKGDLPDNSSF